MTVFILSIGFNYGLFYADGYHNFNVWYYEDLMGAWDYPELYTPDYMNSHYRVYEDYLKREDGHIKWKYRYFVEEYQPLPKSNLDKFFGYDVGYGITVSQVLLAVLACGLLLCYYILMYIIWSQWQFQNYN
jgi:hypothetical protein